MKFQSIPLPPREAPSEGPQAYSAIVYYDNPHVVARNSKGSLIDSGIAYEMMRRLFSQLLTPSPRAWSSLGE